MTYYKSILRLVLLNNSGGARKNIYFANEILEKYGIKTFTYIKKPDSNDLYTSSEKVPFDYKHNFIHAFFFILKKSKEKDFIVNLHLKNTIILFGLFLLLFKIPYCCVIHQTYESKNLRQKFTNFFYRYVLSKSVFNVSISPFIQSILKEINIDSILLNNASEDLGLKEWNGQINKIGVVGELVERKGVIELPYVRKVLDDKYDINVYGKGKLEKIVRGFDYLKFRGYQSIQTIIKEVDVLLFLSYEEPFGRVITEFMSAGKPILARNSGAPPHIINDDAQIFNHMKEINKKLKFIEMNHLEIVKKNRKRFEDEYSFDIYEKKLIDLYKYKKPKSKQ